jgi:hypothetical protein
MYRSTVFAGWQGAGAHPQGVGTFHEEDDDDFQMGKD